jgi:hypothetical protein
MEHHIVDERRSGLDQMGVEADLPAAGAAAPLAAHAPDTRSGGQPVDPRQTLGIGRREYADRHILRLRPIPTAQRRAQQQVDSGRGRQLRTTNLHADLRAGQPRTAADRPGTGVNLQPVPLRPRKSCSAPCFIVQAIDGPRGLRSGCSRWHPPSRHIARRPHRFVRMSAHKGALTTTLRIRVDPHRDAAAHSAAAPDVVIESDLGLSHGTIMP